MIASASPIQVRPRVLFLTCHLPWPAISGGRRRELELIRRIGAEFDVHLLAVSKTPAVDRGNVTQLARWCQSVEVLAAESGRGDRVAAQVARHRCPEAGARIARRLAAGIDLIHVEGYYLMQHLVGTDHRAPVLLVEQNVEHQLALQRAGLGVPDLEASVDYLRTRAEELACWRRADMVAAVTVEDGDAIAAALGRPDVRVVPAGADHVASPPRPVVRPADAPPLAVFVANFAYAPNVDAAIHLCRDILPRIRHRVPDVELWLVGNEPPTAVCELAGPNVRVTGRVDDVTPYLDAADVVPCPLRIGGGIKVKAIEAIRRGKAIVSSSIGAQGLPADARAAIVVADTAHEFADAMTNLLLDPARRQQLGAQALAAAAALPSWDDAAEALAGTYRELLAAAAVPVRARRAAR